MGKLLGVLGGMGPMNPLAKHRLRSGSACHFSAAVLEYATGLTPTWPASGRLP